MTSLQRFLGPTNRGHQEGHIRLRKYCERGLRSASAVSGQTHQATVSLTARIHIPEQASHLLRLVAKEMDITKYVASSREKALLYGDYGAFRARLSGRLLKCRKKLNL